MKLSFVDEGSPPAVAQVDGLTHIDSYCLFIAADERPLKGLSAAIDWRLCGVLSRYLYQEHFSGRPGEAFLFPVRGCIPGGRVFCFGVDAYPERTPQKLGRLMAEAIDRVGRAGAKRIATMLPSPFGMTAMESSRYFIREVAHRFLGDEIVLVGNARALAEIGQEVSMSSKGMEIETAKWLNTSPVRGTRPIREAPMRPRG